MNHLRKNQNKKNRTSLGQKYVEKINVTLFKAVLLKYSDNLSLKYDIDFIYNCF